MKAVVLQCVKVWIAFYYHAWDLLWFQIYKILSLYSRYCLYPFSVLSLSGTLLRSMFDFSLLFLRLLSMGIPGDWRMFLQREYLLLLLPSARGAFHSGLPWTNFSLISLSALWYKESVWIQSQTLRGKQPVVTQMWKMFSIFQGPRQRQTSALVCALVSRVYPLTEGVACEGPCFSNSPPAPTRPGNPGVESDNGKQEPLEGSCCLHSHFFHILSLSALSWGFWILKTFYSVF